MDTTREGHRTVVGVDGSEASYGALRWALEDAKRRGGGAAVHVVHVHPLEYAPNMAEVPVAWHGDIESHDRGRQLIDAVLKRAVDDGFGDVNITRQEAVGHTARTLLESAKDAEQLVVGSRGHGGFTGLLLGSVAQSCVAHASCPVVVVPLS